MMRTATAVVISLLLTLTAQQNVEQTAHGTGPSPALVESFDGMGVGFEGPQGKYEGRNPSDNGLAVGPDHIVQTVNSRLAIFTKKGRTFDTTGRVLYGPVNTNTVFAGLGGPCEARNNGDAVVRYDQLANRWLITMPIFSRIPLSEVGERRPLDQPAEPGHLALPGQASLPGAPVSLPANPPAPPPPQGRGQRGQTPAGQPPAPPPPSTYAMCYAISKGPDPMGPYYRYAFERPLFPDYPRPAIWIDGYYVPTSSSDDRISETIATQKHACVVDRARMLKGLPASEQCQIVLNVNFLNNADIDGRSVPPDGAPNVMLAAGGTQLDKILDADTIDVWQFHVDWKTPANTKLVGPEKIKVAPYHYLCGGQLTNCVPQPGTDRGLDAQGDKIMSRVVYRRIGNREAMVAVHSVDTAAGGGGGVRWYELVIDSRSKARTVSLSQQGTYAPGGFYRWMASPAIDRFGNIGIGYSFGGTPNFAGQRFAGRQPHDPPGVLTLKEAILAEGEAAQTNTLRWEDYTTTAIDPLDDCTVWYVGDYLKKSAATYSTRIGAFRMPGCGR